MIKLIEPSFDFDMPILYYLPVCNNHTFDSVYLKKRASETPNFTPDPKYEYVHMIAVGSFEKYGCNKNGDAFTADVCREYHPTFVKYAKHYKNHRHYESDPSFGHVVWSTFNEPMGRIELIVALDKNAKENQEMLEKIAENIPVGVSMSCKVSHDICSICGNKARTRMEYCDHAKYHLTKLASDGKLVCVFNPDPKFFDISEVRRPADRIGYALCKAASVDRVIPSSELAEMEGLIVDPFIKLSKEDYDLYKKFAEMEKQVEGIIRKNPTIVKVVKIQSGKWDEIVDKLTKDQIPELLKYIAFNKIILPYEKFKKILEKYHGNRYEEDVIPDKIISNIEPEELEQHTIFNEMPNVLKLSDILPDLHDLNVDKLKGMILNISTPTIMEISPSGISIKKRQARVIIKKSFEYPVYKLYANLIYAQAKRHPEMIYYANFSNV